ncbi:MAG TPA: hypothetical protein VKI61_11045 [Chitinophagaceae bacterium]|jgi:hypothetical protein|nr:hypothetical protein [Chitinophagaceae bacterium]
MKKIIIALTISAALLSSVATYAAVTNPDISVKQAFAKEFTQVKDVEWTTIGKEGVYEAKFTFNNESVSAFFTEEGEFLGTTRQITISQLPIIVVTELNKQYAGVRIATIFEYSKKDGPSYYITLISEKGSKIIKASSNGELLVYKKNA